MHDLGIEKEKYLEELHYTEVKPLLNPELLLHEGDEYHIITGRHEVLKDITLKWCRKYCPNAKSVSVVGGKAWYEFSDFVNGKRNPVEAWAKWNKESCGKKAEMIKMLGIEVYFDDSPSNVKQLRESLPKVKVIQYAGRISVY